MKSTPKMKSTPNKRTRQVAVLFVALAAGNLHKSECFSSVNRNLSRRAPQHLELQRGSDNEPHSLGNFMEAASKTLAAVALSASLFVGLSAHAEDELAAKYGGKGFDSSLVDQTCLVDKCSLQAKACLADDPSCRKGLTCTAKCMGDNACITGCMARYGDKNLDNLLKCTIEDNECIKVAILDGGADAYGEEPRPPAPTVQRFDLKSMEGSWYKVVGYNPNYDCYACQRNTFTAPEGGNMLIGNDKLNVDVEFSMPHLLPDGSPPPPKNVREMLSVTSDDGILEGSQSIALNEYATHETMVFDSPSSPMGTISDLVLKKGQVEKSYARTAHSEGEMFGLKFWENWYVIGENDPGQDEFKFIFYNGKTRQNTYEGAFVYSRTKDLSVESMKKVYKIASDAGMDPDQFCKIRNGCFREPQQPATGLGSPSNPFRGILASTKVSQFLGVEPVAAENNYFVEPATALELRSTDAVSPSKRSWWNELNDYLENPHIHFNTMESTRLVMDWPDEVKNQQ